MSLHINKFIERVRSTELRGRKDVILTMAEAKDLHADITRLLLVIEELRSPKASDAPEVVEVQVRGGDF